MKQMGDRLAMNRNYVTYYNNTVKVNELPSIIILAFPIVILNRVVFVII